MIKDGDVMNGVDWLLLLVVLVANIVTTFAFLNEKVLKNIAQEQNSSSVNKVQVIYSVLFILINIGISVLFLTLYQDNTILFSLKRLLLLAILWPIGYIDFKTYKIPNRFILLGLIFRAFILVFELFFERDLLVSNLISEGIAAGALVIAALLCSLCIKNSIGYGDIKLFIVMGLMLGLEGIWSSIFVSLLVAFIVAVVLLISRKKGKKDAIPFAPSIAIGTYISIIMTGM